MRTLRAPTLRFSTRQWSVRTAPGRSREDREAARGIAQLLRQPGKAGDVGRVERLVFQPFQKARQLGFVLAVGGQELVERGLGEIAKIGVIMLDRAVPTMRRPGSISPSSCSA
jgi:hypothetical protein